MTHPLRSPPKERRPDVRASRGSLHEEHASESVEELFWAEGLHKRVAKQRLEGARTIDSDARRSGEM